MADYQTVDHDVLVIGAGGAGLRAALLCEQQSRQQHDGMHDRVFLTVMAPDVHVEHDDQEGRQAPPHAPGGT